jgi:hypothetical protein
MILNSEKNEKTFSKNRVINEGMQRAGCVINEPLTSVPAWVSEYANNLRETAKVRGHQRPSGWWWRRLSPQLQAFMLGVCVGPEWERYAEVEWAALPGGLRTEISRLSRTMVRFLEGCPWR